MVRLNPDLVRPFRVPDPPSAPWPVLDASGVTMMTITSIVVTPADDDRSGCGLLAYVVIELDGLLRIDGITIRRVDRERLALSFPKRRARNGASHPIVRPINGAARARLERTIFNAIRIRQEVRP